MTYEDKAKLIARELAGGSSLEDAVRMLDLRAEPRRGRRVVDALTRQAMRARRMAGEKLSVIALDFELSEGTVWNACRDIPAPRTVVPEIALELVRLAAIRFGITEVQFFPAVRGRPPERVWRARWAALLAMRALGIEPAAMARIFRRAPADLQAKAHQAENDRELVRAAAALVAEVQAATPSADTRTAA